MANKNNSESSIQPHECKAGVTCVEKKSIPPMVQSNDETGWDTRALAETGSGNNLISPDIQSGDKCPHGVDGYDCYICFPLEISGDKGCPQCKTGSNMKGHSGYPDKCFHCGNCGYTECAETLKGVEEKAYSEGVNNAKGTEYVKGIQFGIEKGRAQLKAQVIEIIGGMRKDGYPIDLAGQLMIDTHNAILTNITNSVEKL